MSELTEAEKAFRECEDAVLPVSAFLHDVFRAGWKARGEADQKALLSTSGQWHLATLNKASSAIAKLDSE